MVRHLRGTLRGVSRFGDRAPACDEPQARCCSAPCVVLPLRPPRILRVPCVKPWSCDDELGAVAACRAWIEAAREWLLRNRKDRA